MGAFQQYNNLADIPEPFKNYTVNENTIGMAAEENIEANSMSVNSGKNNTMCDSLFLFLLIYYFF